MVKKQNTKSRIISLRVSNASLEDLEEIFAYKARISGVRITMSSVLTWALEQGIKVIQNQMDKDREAH